MEYIRQLEQRVTKLESLQRGYDPVNLKARAQQSFDPDMSNVTNRILSYLILSRT